ncbi:MAG TPA: hypothetical protein VJN62_12895 [Gemmatimonadales bacterium]|nr:hypothetical protein [Gemmatimonadales bacterium]
MRRSMLAICALLAVTTAGCEQLNKVKGLFSKKQPPPPPTHQVTPPAQQTPAPAPANAAKPGQARPGQAAQQPHGPVTPVQDKPYSSPDTGTVAPGMSESQVYSLWGAPTEVRHAGTRTYLFFPNGCERSCGTADIVTLDNGQVVDAIVRWYGHGYSGQSSSPRSGPPTRGHRATPLTMPDTTHKDTSTAAPAVTPAPTPAPAPAPAADSTKPKPDSTVKADSTKPKPDSSTH